MGRNVTETEVVEMKVSKAWAKFMSFCQTEVPYGNVKIKLENGQPTDLLEAKRKVRFDKEATLPISFSDDLE